MSTAKLNAEQRETVHRMLLDVIEPYGLKPTAADSPLLQRILQVRKLAEPHALSREYGPRGVKSVQRYFATRKTTYLSAFVGETEVCLAVSTFADVFSHGPTWVGVQLDRYVFVPAYQKYIDWLFEGAPMPYENNVCGPRFVTTFELGINFWSFSYKIGEERTCAERFQHFVDTMKDWPKYISGLADEDWVRACMLDMSNEEALIERKRNRTMLAYMRCFYFLTAVTVFHNLYYRVNLEQTRLELQRLLDHVNPEHPDYLLGTVYGCCVADADAVRANTTYVVQRMQLWLESLLAGQVIDIQ